jgi:hypothetical protein
VTAWVLALLLASAPEASPPASDARPAGAPHAAEAPHRSPDHRRLDEILSRREFRAARRASGVELAAPEPPEFLRWLGRELRDGLKRLFDWIEELLRRKQPKLPEGGGWIGSSAGPLTWALLALGVTLLCVAVFRLARRRGAGGPIEPADAGAPAARGLPDALSRSVEAWSRLAEQFERQGQWRLALRALYLELLATLHQRRAIRYERPRTNGDFVAMLRGHPAGEPFGRLSAAFDLAWYGNKPFGAADYGAALGLARDVERLTGPADAP